MTMLVCCPRIHMYSILGLKYFYNSFPWRLSFSWKRTLPCKLSWTCNEPWKPMRSMLIVPTTISCNFHIVFQPCLKISIQRRKHQSGWSFTWPLLLSCIIKFIDWSTENNYQIGPMYAWTMLTEFNCQSTTHLKNAVVFFYIHALFHTL